ncbi:MAG: SH3-like domain-containing protein [Pseudomonadota bacterium]
MHDLGGKQGFGTVVYEPGDAHRDEDWELRARALSALLVEKKIYNMDEYRHAIERMDPRHYLTASYYERVMTAVATLCVEKGLLTVEELEDHAESRFPLSKPIGPGRQNAPAQKFLVGEAVRVKNEFVSGHVRMPGYIRGKPGIVVGETPAYPFPDSSGHGMPITNEPTYDVRFSSRDLWPDSSDDAFVHVGVFQSYLEKIA